MITKVKNIYGYFQILRVLIEFLDDITGIEVSHQEVKEIILEFADDMINKVEAVTIDFLPNEKMISILDLLIDLIFKSLDLKKGIKRNVSRVKQ